MRHNFVKKGGRYVTILSLEQVDIVATIV